MALKLKGPRLNALDTFETRILAAEGDELQSDPGIIFSFLSIFPPKEFQKPIPLLYFHRLAKRDHRYFSSPFLNYCLLCKIAYHVNHQ